MGNGWPGVRIRKNKHGDTIQIDYTWNGRRYRETLALPPTKANLKYAAGLRAEILGKIAKGTFEPGNKQPIKMGELLDSFLASCAKSVENRTLSPSTADAYRKVVNGHLRPQFGALLAASLSAQDIKAWLLPLGVTAKTARNILTPLRLVLDDALNAELIDANPLHKLAIGRLLSRSAKASSYEVDPFSADEVAAILAACTGQARNLLQFAFATGLRTSELIALRWADIEGKAMRVSRAVVVGVEKGPKTAAGVRVVELSPEALAALQEQKAWTYLAGGRVFSVRHLRTIHRLWKRALTRAGVRYRRQYCTRHTFASALLSAGANPWWVAKQMGHKTVEMVFRHYGRWIGTDAARGSGSRSVSD